MAARAIAACAERLGVASLVRTAVTGVEVLARLTERPADTILVDTAVARPDPVGFVRRVLAQVPGATLVLFGPEDSVVASALVAAGARGLIRSSDKDLVSAVTKTLLLLWPPPRPAAPPAPDRSNAGVPVAVPAATRPVPNGPSTDPSRAESPTRLSAQAQVPASLVPTQREDELGHPRRPALTERELQVLRGMADGKSNAEIGRELFVSEDTVKTHARRLFRKLGARDRAHAVASGFRAGLVS
jgi:DNA-binding NarL/FixJ family response regulator